MVKGFFEELGCQETRVYDVGITEWGAPGNPVVYAKCDEGAPRDDGHLLDVRHDAGHPARRLEGAAVRGAPRRAGAVQEGADRPRRHQLQGTADVAAERADGDQGGARASCRSTSIFVAEGDEERMDIGVRKFVKDHPDLFKNADALIGDGRSAVAERRRQLRRRVGRLRLRRADDQRASRGAAGRRAVGHPRRRTSARVDSPAWRHIKMLASLVSEDGNTPLIKGFFDGIEPLSSVRDGAA